VKPWLAPGVHGSPAAVGAGAEDGHYQVPDDLILVGAALETGLELTRGAIFSLGAEYNLVFDRNPEGRNGAVAFVGLNVPLRARLIGIGDEHQRFYLVLGLGYAALWDRTIQYAPVTTDGSALHSTGAMYELGLCYRLLFDDRVGLEIGFVPRVQLTGAVNGASYYGGASFSQVSVPIHVSLPFWL
jgi:hypothetical protein